jgi:energy-coupling factor transporter ATP-binding protein EcfA2
MPDVSRSSSHPEKPLVTREQLREAARRQRLHGGRIGQSLIALGYLREDQLGDFFIRSPHSPETVEDTGLDLDFIADLALKHAYGMGEFRLADLSRRMGLPTVILDDAIELLRREKLVEVRSANQFTKSTFNFIITGPGKHRAGELMEICRYVGPAPVTLPDYREMVEHQSIRNITLNDEVVHAAFSKLVISEHMLSRIGPAISSGAPIFLYGPAGNGKTTIAETVGEILPETVYVPYALYVAGQIIVVFDPVNHVPVPDLPGETADEAIDRRWVRVQRPIVISGGELTLRMLDLEFNAIAKLYEAPLQMKANNGLFVLDDFGRQKMDPQSLLNRWIINLDRQIDFMSMHTGMKFEIPFDQLVIFSTNLEPKGLVDEAFLRRIRYKIKIDRPSQAEFEEIFKHVCQMNGVGYRAEVFRHLVERHYRQRGIPFSACHPRDLIDHILDLSHFYGEQPEMSRATIDHACENYFVDD